MKLLDRLTGRGTTSFEFSVGGLNVKAETAGDLQDEARASALRYWEQIESYLVGHSAFKTALAPVPAQERASPLMKRIADAAWAAGVGPMTALPGAFVEAIASDLAIVTRHAVISAEGDTFAIGVRSRTLAVEGRLAVRVRGLPRFAFYTSSGRTRVDPAIGNARAVAVLAAGGAMAGAAGSRIGQSLHRAQDVDRALEVARGLDGVLGAVVLSGGRIGVYGEIEVTSLRGPRR